MLGAVLAWALATLLPAHPALGFLVALVVSPLVVGAVALVAERLVLKPAELQSGSDDRRHDRLALHHPAAGAHLLRARCAPGRGAVQLPHPAALVRLFRLQARRSSPPRRCWYGHLAGAHAHAARPGHARHAVRPRDRAGLRHPRRAGLCGGLRARRHAGGGRRRAGRADPAGALSDGPRPAAALLHRRHHRRARLAQRHGGGGRADRHEPTASSRSSSRPPWPRSSPRFWWRWCWCSGRRGCSGRASR